VGVPAGPITSVPSTDYPAVGAMLARAFGDDPVWSALWPDPEHRADALRQILGALTRTTIVAGGHARAIGDGAGAALWTQPGVELGVQAIVRSGFALPRSVVRLPRSEMRMLLAVLTRLEKRRRALVGEPHWYLQCIGVDPAQQGQGLGGALVRDGLALADRDRASVYLETETELNVAFYEHLGFRVVEMHRLDELKVPVWLMVRRPRRT
jgi:ribosomal protein S18 acetylase RimI-like enzyme